MPNMSILVSDMTVKKLTNTSDILARHNSHELCISQNEYKRINCIHCKSRQNYNKSNTFNYTCIINLHCIFIALYFIYSLHSLLHRHRYIRRNMLSYGLSSLSWLDPRRIM